MSNELISGAARGHAVRAGNPYGWSLDGHVSLQPPAIAWPHFAPGSYQLIVAGAAGEKSYPFTVLEGRKTTVAIQ